MERKNKQLPEKQEVACCTVLNGHNSARKVWSIKKGFSTTTKTKPQRPKRINDILDHKVSLPQSWDKKHPPHPLPHDPVNPADSCTHMYMSLSSTSVHTCNCHEAQHLHNVNCPDIGLLYTQHITVNKLNSCTHSMQLVNYIFSSSSLVSFTLLLIIHLPSNSWH